MEISVRNLSENYFSNKYCQKQLNKISNWSKIMKTQSANHMHYLEILKQLISHFLIYPFTSSEIKNIVIIITTINIIKWPIPVFKCQIKQSAIGGLQIYTLTLFRNNSLICYDQKITLCAVNILTFPSLITTWLKLRWKHAGKSSFSLHANAYNHVDQVCFPSYQRTEDRDNI